MNSSDTSRRSRAGRGRHDRAIGDGEFVLPDVAGGLDTLVITAVPRQPSGAHSGRLYALSISLESCPWQNPLVGRTAALQMAFPTAAHGHLRTSRLATMPPSERPAYFGARRKTDSTCSAEAALQPAPIGRRVWWDQRLPFRPTRLRWSAFLSGERELLTLKGPSHLRWGNDRLRIRAVAQRHPCIAGGRPKQSVIHQNKQPCFGVWRFRPTARAPCRAPRRPDLQADEILEKRSYWRP